MMVLLSFEMKKCFAESQQFYHEKNEGFTEFEMKNDGFAES